jgi:hypothetical protein
VADTIPPKHPSQRRRRNKPPVPPKSIPRNAKAKRIPALPGKGWNAFAREYWKLIWTSPMSTTYLPADKPALVRLTQLANRVGEGTIGIGALGEMRQLEDRFGLSPLSRRRLQMDIVDPEPADGTGESPEQEERWLRVVGDDE